LNRALGSDRYQILALALDERKQERAILAAGFADGGDVNGRVVLDRALVFADAAPDALDGIDVRALELECRSPAIGDLDVASENGLGADRTDLFADHATGVHCPGETAALVVESSPRLDWPFSFERPDSQLLGD